MVVSLTTLDLSGKEKQAVKEKKRERQKLAMLSCFYALWKHTLLLYPFSLSCQGTPV